MQTVAILSPQPRKNRVKILAIIHGFRNARNQQYRQGNRSCKGKFQDCILSACGRCFATATRTGATFESGNNSDSSELGIASNFVKSSRTSARVLVDRLLIYQFLKLPVSAQGELRKGRSAPLSQSEEIPENPGNSLYLGRVTYEALASNAISSVLNFTEGARLPQGVMQR